MMMALKCVTLLVSLVGSLSVTAIAGASPGYYPSVSGPPVGVAQGVLLEFGRGSRSGGLTIREANGKKLSFYLTREPTLIDNVVVQCPIPPMRNFVPSKADCPSWPSYVKVGRTRVRVYYWRGTHLGQPTLITRKLSVVR
jgi:hypothetical protein